MELSEPKPVPSIPVLVGPTGGGKTAAGVELARALPITAVVADLRQVMKGMEIGTAQPAAEDLAILPHELSGVLEPTQNITVADWRRMALEAIGRVLESRRIPLILGGSGFAIQCLIEDTKFDAPPAPLLRPPLVRWVDEVGLEEAVSKALPLIDGMVRPDNRRNSHRVIRGIERAAFHGRESPPPDWAPDYVRDTWIDQAKMWDENSEIEPETEQYEYRLFALHPDKEWLKERIGRRARRIFEGGILVEVTELLARGVARDARALNGHGYPQALAVLDRQIGLEKAIRRTAQITNQYAKRQMTWRRNKFPGATLLPVGEKNSPEEAIEPLREWIIENWGSYVEMDDGNSG